MNSFKTKLIFIAAMMLLLTVFVCFFIFHLKQDVDHGIDIHYLEQEQHHVWESWIEQVHFSYIDPAHEKIKQIFSQSQGNIDFVKSELAKLNSTDLGRTMAIFVGFDGQRYVLYSHLTQDQGQLNEQSDLTDIADVRFDQYSVFDYHQEGRLDSHSSFLLRDMGRDFWIAKLMMLPNLPQHGGQGYVVILYPFGLKELKEFAAYSSFDVYLANVRGELRLSSDEEKESHYQDMVYNSSVPLDKTSIETWQNQKILKSSIVLKDPLNDWLGFILFFKDITQEEATKFQTYLWSFFSLGIVLLIVLSWYASYVKDFFEGFDDIVSHLKSLADRSYNLPGLYREEADEIDRAGQYLNQVRNAFLTFERVGIQKEKFEKNQADYHFIKRELDVAFRIQQNILPFPHFKTDKIEVSASMKPALDIGGDFYDYFMINDYKLGFVVADVSGKGIPAALFMSMTRSVLRAQALLDYPPSQTLSMVNNILCQGNESSMFVTTFYGVLDLNTRQITYANAGHLQPVVKKYSGETLLLPTANNMALGVMEDMVYQDESTDFPIRDILVVYSDGVTEAINKQEDEYRERFLEQIKQSGDMSLDTLRDKILKDLDEFAKGMPQADDITLLLLT